MVQVVVRYRLSSCSIGSLFYKQIFLSIPDRSVPVRNSLSPHPPTPYENAWSWVFLWVYRSETTYNQQQTIPSFYNTF